MFACLYVPDFAVQAALLSEPALARSVLKQSPLAILDGPANLPRVFGINPAARRAEIEIGMTKLQVETYGGVLLRKRIVALEDAAQEVLLEFAGRFSPRVESTAPGTTILDLSGTEKLFGPWRQTAQNMNAQASIAGFELNVAIASSPDAAFHAARGFAGITIIPAGEEARRLAKLPVDLLPASPQILEILDGWGIRTFHSFAALPMVDIVERLGQEGLYLQKLAGGEINRPLLTGEPVKDFVATYEFDDPVETLESIFFILNRLLQQLCANLLAGAFATNDLKISIGLEVKQLNTGEEREHYQHQWKLPLPTQDKHILFGLIRLHLERVTFSAPIRQITVEVIPVKPRVAQGNLFAPPSPEPEKLEMTLERIRGVVGSSDHEGIACVGSPRPVDTHKPGSFTLQPFTSLAETSFHFDPREESASPTTALRVFRPALETAVELNQEKPQLVLLWHRRLRVLAASGPWCTSGNWWSALAWTREEWDVALKTPEGVGFYRIYWDRICKQWFVEGVFD
ncbi:MAG TPA: DNA polymerase Y family protein [Terriglobales bacterium]|jgi:protein ImuB|nr:DNA polymerase Y family protein [Terriglobales bacterium]